MAGLGAFGFFVFLIGVIIVTVLWSFNGVAVILTILMFVSGRVGIMQGRLRS